MIPVGRLLDVSVYSLLIFVPFLFLGIYPFRRHLRFSFRTTNALVVVICILQIAMGIASTFWGVTAKPLYLIRTCIYAVFYFIMVDTSLGELSFTLLSLSNFGNLVSVCAKCLEHLIFGELALEPYQWSLCLCVFFLQLLISVPLYFYITMQFSRVVHTSHFAWRYLWIVPTVFYVIWYYHLYLVSKSSLDVALNVHSTMYLVVINLGAFLIYHTEVMLIKEKETAQELILKNHLLTMQELQYDNLQNRINEARQARHDIRHHTHLIREYLRSGKFQELENYLDSYTASLPDSSALIYCQHYATNALLGFFSRQAKECGIKMNVFVQLPDTIQIPETVLSVVLGNLLENALEACRQTSDGKKKITVQGKMDMGSVFFSISNTFEGELHRSKSGKILSTKSANRGLGLESVAQLVQSNGGMMEVEAENGTFRVCVLLPEQTAPVSA